MRGRGKEIEKSIKNILNMMHPPKVLTQAADRQKYKLTKEEESGGRRRRRRNMGTGRRDEESFLMVNEKYSEDACV